VDLGIHQTGKSIEPVRAAIHEAEQALQRTCLGRVLSRSEAPIPFRRFSVSNLLVGLGNLRFLKGVRI